MACWTCSVTSRLQSRRPPAQEGGRPGVGPEPLGQKRRTGGGPGYRAASGAVRQQRLQGSSPKSVIAVEGSLIQQVAGRRGYSARRVGFHKNPGVRSGMTSSSVLPECPSPGSRFSATSCAECSGALRGDPGGQDPPPGPGGPAYLSTSAAGPSEACRPTAANRAIGS